MTLPSLKLTFSPLDSTDAPDRVPPFKYSIGIGTKAVWVLTSPPPAPGFTTATISIEKNSSCLRFSIKHKQRI